jgi:hypothetical protein
LRYRITLKTSNQGGGTARRRARTRPRRAWGERAAWRPVPPQRARHVDPAQKPRLEEIRANLSDRLQEARDQRWLGEVAAIETTLAAATQKLTAMRELNARSTTVHLGMPDIGCSAGRSSTDP